MAGFSCHVIYYIYNQGWLTFYRALASLAKNYRVDILQYLNFSARFFLTVENYHLAMREETAWRFVTKFDEAYSLNGNEPQEYLGGWTASDSTGLNYV